METAVKTYSGSLEFLQGGEVLSWTWCSCGKCNIWARPRVYGRVVARVMDPLTSSEHVLYHARRESIGLEP